MPKKKENFITRSMQLDGEPVKIDEKNRSVPAVIATEAATIVLDTDSYDLMREILLTDGGIWPEDGQVVLLDNHSRYEGSVSVKGSVREIKRDKENVRGTVFFASTPDAEEIWIKVKERHLRDVSAGYQVFPDETIILSPGETAVVSGRTFTNNWPDGKNLIIRKKWRLKEVSVTPIGADEHSKLLRNEPDNKPTKQKELDVDPKELEKIKEQARKDAEEALRTAHNKESQEAIRAALEKGRKEEQERQDEIRSIVTTLPENIRGEVEGRLIKNNAAIDAARKEVIEEMRKANEKNAISPDAKIVVDATDKFRDAAIDVIRLNVRGTIKDEDGKRNVKREREILASEIPKTLHGLVRECAFREDSKRSVHRWNGQALYDYAFRAFSVAAGDLPAIMLDATNRMVGDSFAEEPTTYQGWTSVGNANDFRDVNIINKSGLGDWKKILDGEPFQFTTFRDRYEKGSLATYGIAIAIPRKVWINDDLSMLNDIVESLGAGAARKLNMDAYDLLLGTAFAGPTMNEDSAAMFTVTTTGGRSLNFKASSGAVTAANLSTMESILKGLKRPLADKSSKTVRMGLPATILLTGTDNEASIKAVLYNTQDISKSIPGVINQWYGRLTPIFEPYYQDYATTASAANSWHLFSKPPIKVLYLNGNTRPTIRRSESQASQALGTIMDAYFDYGFIPVDWRYGVYGDGK